jgi:fumarate reductase flavoprotein subunit
MSSDAFISGKLKADIVVIGGGGGGLAAAVAAAEAGVKNVIVLEANKAPGGNSLFPGGLMAVETPLQKRLGVDAPRDVVFQKAMDYAHWKLNGRLVRALIDKSSDTISWLEGKGLIFDTLIPHYPNPDPNTFHAVGGRFRTGTLIVKTLVKNCQDIGVQILLRTRAKKILTDARGRISGILAESRGGEIEIETGCIITATGGFTGNVELLKKYDPLYDENEVDHGGMLHNGDGTLMAKEIGAATDEDIIFEMFGPNFKESIRLTQVAKNPCVVWVNRNGERFVNEDTPSDMEAANPIYRQPHKACYSVLDQKILEHVADTPLGPLDGKMIPEKKFREGMAADCKLQAEKGKIKIADSIEELAAWIGAEPSVLRRTVDEYNASCDLNYDKLFLKNRRYLMPLRTPPYYVIPGRVSIVVTHGGIKTNHRMEALDAEEKTVPGLYAAGTEIAGTSANTYNIFLSGHSFGFSINSGRIAGEEAAKYVMKK